MSTFVSNKLRFRRAFLYWAYFQKSSCKKHYILMKSNEEWHCTEQISYAKWRQCIFNTETVFKNKKKSGKNRTISLPIYHLSVLSDLIEFTRLTYFYLSILFTFSSHLIVYLFIYLLAFLSDYPVYLFMFLFAYLSVYISVPCVFADVYFDLLWFYIHKLMTSAHLDIFSVCDKISQTKVTCNQFSL